MNAPRPSARGRLPAVAATLGVLMAACTGTATPSPEPTATPRAVPTPAPSLTPSPTPAPPVVQLAWFYRPPADHDLVTLAQNYSAFVLTFSDEAERDQLKAMGARGPFLQYMTLNAIQDPGGCNSQPFHSQVAFHIGDFCDISLNHPDWFMQDKSGSRIPEGYDQDYWLMNPSNPQWRAFWLNRVREVQESLGWDGVFLDFTEASLGLRQRVGPLPAGYGDDASWRAANVAFVKYLYTSYFKPSHRPLFANIGEVRDRAGWLDFLPVLDGLMNEGWAVGWHEGEYRPVAEWEADLAQVETIQSAGKQVILVSQGAADDLQRQQFAFGSYLLVANGRALFRYATNLAYTQGKVYDDYLVNLGQPLGPRTKTGDAWQRDFEHGRVIVDPAKHTASIDVK